MSTLNPHIVALCKSLIGTPSVTGAGTRRIAEFCATGILAPRGIEARLIPSPNEGAEQVNLLALVAGTDRAATPLLLNTHLDTVPPGDLALWTECNGDPFEASIDGDHIYGLGAADTKLDFLAKAIALAECGKPHRDVWLVGTFGEEHGLVGAKELAASGILPKRAIAMVGEPSHLKAITAHKGLMAFELAIRFEPLRADRELDARKFIVSGKAAHSSTPALGENAIEKALAAIRSQSKIHLVSIDGGDAVNKVPARCEIVVAASTNVILDGFAVEPCGTIAHFIPRMALVTMAQFARALPEFANAAGPAEADYAAPTLTSNLGVVRTRDDAIILEFELRPPPSLALDLVRGGVNAIVQRLADNAPALNLELIERRANSGFRSSDGSEAVELAMAALTRARLPLETGVKSGCTEAGVYAVAGLHPIVFGPGPSVGVIHAPNEYNLLSEVEAAIGFYRALLEDSAG
jgi:acetylornithine deacetylase/succinyl-diaminopimelate desuccinylase-like protein